MFLLTLIMAFLMTAYVVKSNQHQLRPTSVTTDEVRSMSVHVQLVHLYHEMNDMITKVSLCDKINDESMYGTRALILHRIAEDFDDMTQKLSDTFKIMRHNFDQGSTIGYYTSFDRWMGNVDYEWGVAQ